MDGKNPGSLWDSQSLSLQRVNGRLCIAVALIRQPGHNAIIYIAIGMRRTTVLPLVLVYLLDTCRVHSDQYLHYEGCMRVEIVDDQVACALLVRPGVSLMARRASFLSLTSVRAVTCQ